MRFYFVLFAVSSLNIENQLTTLQRQHRAIKPLNPLFVFFFEFFFSFTLILFTAGISSSWNWTQNKFPGVRRQTFNLSMALEAFQPFLIFGLRRRN